jgi:hypothetical protein
MNKISLIDQFNKYLVNNLNFYDINKYFKSIQIEFYSNLDISFMEYFLELMNNNHQSIFIVNNIKLQEYQIITNIQNSLDALMLNENIDYQIINKEYKLTLNAFKLCLIYSNDSKKYGNYYLLLEEIFKKYQEYQIIYLKSLIDEKDNQINILKNKNNKQKLLITKIKKWFNKKVNN